MPFSVHSIGTGLFTASKKRTIEGQTQFDAIEALMGLYLPILPYRVIHVVSSDTQGMHDQYTYLPLRFSLRLVFQAFLTRWGNIFLWVGVGVPVAFEVFRFMHQDPRKPQDYVLFAIFGSAALFGGLCLLALNFIRRRDEKIKDILGSHAYGSSDPVHWPKDVAERVSNDLLAKSSAPSLLYLAREAHRHGNTELAMLCVRLSQRDRTDIEASQLLEQMLIAQEIS